MIRTISILHFFICSLCATIAIAQDCCDTDGKIVLCYTPNQSYCTFDNCHFNFDGFYMQGLAAKIGNPDNFGLSGTVSCVLDVQPLININTVDDIEALSCDIVFIGNYSTINNGGFGTTLPSSFLETVRTWSIKCEENLTILFQGEAAAWGYEIVDFNTNPNIPGQGVEINIFDGPFGSLEQFDQGGTFQAIFNALPPTGSTILARDGAEQPSIILDTETNDIVLSDVGIMANGLGPISVSPNILNNNDILACNIIALGCDLATNLNYEEVVICPGSTYILPNGDSVTDEGDYLNQLTSDVGCDSLLFITIIIDRPRDTLIMYDGCVDDGYGLQVGESLFDESNPIGTTTIENQYGCDSIVEIDFNYVPLPLFDLDTTICFGDSYVYEGFSITQAIDSVFVFQRNNSCDSTVRLKVNVFNFPSAVIEESVTIVNDAPYTFQNQIPNDHAVTWNPVSDLSCIDCPNPVLSNQNSTPIYTLTLSSSDYSCSQVFDIPVEYLCEFYMPTVFSPNAFDANNTFGPMAPCKVQGFEMVIYDKWGSEVYRTEEVSSPWDGRHEGKALLGGVYVYSLSYLVNGEPKGQAGFVQLLR